MIKKLRLKFILTIMVIVLVLLGLMLGMVLVSTRAQMERDNIQMMREIALRPRVPALPADSSDMNLPFFRITVNKEGEILSCAGGYYDLSDEELLYRLIPYPFLYLLPGALILTAYVALITGGFRLADRIRERKTATITK